MRCARCHRDTPSVIKREPPYFLILCDFCYEYEKTWYAYKGESMSKDSTEFHRLYKRLSELAEEIESLKAAELRATRGSRSPWLTEPR